MKKFEIKTYGNATFKKTYIVKAENIEIALQKIKNGDISTHDYVYSDEQEFGLDIDDDLNYSEVD